LPRINATKVSTLLFNGKASDFGGFSKLLSDHRDLLNHQVVLVSSGVLAAGKYKVRFVPDDDAALEATVDTTKLLDMTSANSAMAVFTGVIRGIHLEVDTGFTTGETISAVISSYTTGL